MIDDLFDEVDELANVDEKNFKRDQQNFKPVFKLGNVVDIKSKIETYERTKTNGDPNYCLPTDPDEDSIDDMNPSQEWHLAWIDKNDLVVSLDVQRSRNDCTDNKLLKSWEDKGKFDWSKFEPIQAIKYRTGGKKGKDIYIVTNGWGRLMHLYRHPKVKKVQVLYRESDKYEDVANSFFDLHDKKNSTPILKSDDFISRFKQGYPAFVSIVEFIEDNGFKFDGETKYDRNSDKKMVFDRSDLMYLLFDLDFHTSDKGFTYTQFMKMRSIISKYALIRSYLLDGQPFNHWARILGCLYTDVNTLKTELNTMGDLSFLNLIVKPSSSIRKTVVDKSIKDLIDNSENSRKIGMKDYIRKCNWALVKRLEEAQMIDKRWCNDSGNGKTYLEELTVKYNL